MLLPTLIHEDGAAQEGSGGLGHEIPNTISTPFTIPSHSVSSVNDPNTSSAPRRYTFNANISIF